MHELSIAMSIVELAEEEADRRGVQIEAVHLKLGALAGIVKEALLSCYEMACENTPLAVLLNSIEPSERGQGGLSQANAAVVWRDSVIGPHLQRAAA